MIIGTYICTGRGKILDRKMLILMLEFKSNHVNRTDSSLILGTRSVNTISYSH